MNLKEILTPREFEFARKVSLAHSNKEIAEGFGLKLRYMKMCINRIFEKVGVNSRIELAVRFAVEEERGLYETTQYVPIGHFGNGLLPHEACLPKSAAAAEHRKRLHSASTMRQ